MKRFLIGISIFLVSLLSFAVPVRADDASLSISGGGAKKLNFCPKSVKSIFSACRSCLLADSFSFIDFSLYNLSPTTGWPMEKKWILI